MGHSAQYQKADHQSSASERQGGWPAYVAPTDYDQGTVPPIYGRSAGQVCDGIRQIAYVVILLVPGATP